MFIICKENYIGKFETIYCNSSGALDEAGIILSKAYKSNSQVEKLLELGNIKSLGVNPVVKKGNKVAETLIPGISSKCEGYEEVVEAENNSYRELCEEFVGAEKLYVFKTDNKWYYKDCSIDDRNKLELLDYKIEKDEHLRQKAKLLERKLQEPSLDEMKA